MYVTLVCGLTYVKQGGVLGPAQKMSGTFITKHNRAGKGLGVHLFSSVEALQSHFDSGAFAESVDGITLIQECIQAPKPYITRVEFVGGEFLYAVRVDTSLGFELCPADVCPVGDVFCPAGETALARAVTTAAAQIAAAPRFRIVKDFDHPIIERYRRFISDNGIAIAGIEFITDQRGELYTYDVNTNTNYNVVAEAEAGVYGMRAIAVYLGHELRRVSQPKRDVRAAA